MIFGDRVELFKLDPFHRLEFIFQLVEAHDARLAIVQRFGQQLGRQDRGRQSLNGERLNIDFTIASGDLLQAHADHHALVAGVDHIEYRVTHPGAQLTVQAFIA